MAGLRNMSPFAADLFGVLDVSGQLSEVAVVWATYEARPGRPLRVAEVQTPVPLGDVPFGEPGLSSIRYEGEIAWEKPRVDVLVNGMAHVPGGRKAEQVSVKLRVGDIAKEILVTGDRTKYFGRASSPQFFERMPIRYERAFGGGDGTSIDLRNPVGLGYRGAASRHPEIKTEFPNIEYPSHTGSAHSTPAGLGIVARSWQPRLALAGTYNAVWQAEQCPLLPKDFDTRYFQSAPADQQSATLKGGEPVELQNLTSEGYWRFSLPIPDVPVGLWTARGRDVSGLRLDTVLLDPEHYLVTMVLRLRLVARRGCPPLQEVVLGHVTRGWERARLTRKIYVDTANTNKRPTGVVK